MDAEVLLFLLNTVRDEHWFCCFRSCCCIVSYSVRETLQTSLHTLTMKGNHQLQDKTTAFKKRANVSVM